MRNLRTYLGKEQEATLASLISRELHSEDSGRRVSATNALVNVTAQAGAPVNPELVNSHVLDRVATGYRGITDEEARNYFTGRSESIVDGLDDEALKAKVIGFMPVDVNEEDALFYELSGKHREARVWQERAVKLQRGEPITNKREIVEDSVKATKTRAKEFCDDTYTSASDETKNRWVETMARAHSLSGGNSIEGIVAENTQRSAEDFYETAGDNVLPYAKRCILYKAGSGDNQLVDFARNEVVRCSGN